MPFYKRDLSIHEFWYLWGRPGNKPLVDTEEQLSFEGVRSYTGVFDWEDWSALLNPMLFRDSCILTSFLGEISVPLQNLIILQII